MQTWFKRFIVRPMTQTMAEATWFGFLFSAVLIAAMVNLATNALSDLVGALLDRGLAWAAAGSDAGFR